MSTQIRDQLAHLDRLMAAHETYWAAVAQQNPRSDVMRAFLRGHWDPVFTEWNDRRQNLDSHRAVVDETGTLRDQLVPAPDDAIAAFVRDASQKLSSVRQFAAQNQIPTPDLGTAQYGFGEAPRVAANMNQAPQLTPNLSGAEGEYDMNTYAGCDNAMVPYAGSPAYVGCATCPTMPPTYPIIGADGQSYPEVAARAVQSVAAQRPSPFYGYVRNGFQQKVYLFPQLQDVTDWFVNHNQTEGPHDYAAVFAAPDLSAPVPGMEHYKAPSISGGHTFIGPQDVNALIGCWNQQPQVGNWLLPVLGIPLGAVGGYYYGKWRAQHPGKILPFVGQDPGFYGYPPVVGRWGGHVGAQVGAPWMGAQAQQGPADDAARRAQWPQTQALIQSAIDEVTAAAEQQPAGAYVWNFDAPSHGPTYGSTPGSTVSLEGQTMVVPFDTYANALAFVRDTASSNPIATAVFDRSSTHWPNPVNWRKSTNPEDQPIIAQYLASQGSTQMSGAYVGADPTLYAAIMSARETARKYAAARPEGIVGVIHSLQDNAWHTESRDTVDDADEWLDTSTRNPATYSYAAYFNKDDPSFWPRPINEKISGMRSPPGTGLPRQSAAVVGQSQPLSTLNAYRLRGKQLASRVPNAAAISLLDSNGGWHVSGYQSLDDAITWLQRWTQPFENKSRFAYAAAYDKGPDGMAYIQDEEVGRPAVPVSGWAA